MREVGTAWIMAMLDPTAGNVILLSEITRVEVAAALAARHRAGAITQMERDQAVSLLLHHYANEYHALPTAAVMLNRALSLTQNHRLRGYDAVQLATALVINQQYTTAGVPGLTFITADADLVKAAQAEALMTDDPNAHP
jgi:hypothetical protein